VQARGDEGVLEHLELRVASTYPDQILRVALGASRSY
jgi:hypothetical protein